MIYVSTSCVKHKKIKDAVLELVSQGFKNIELSGGTEYYEEFENDLLELKEKYNLNYLCHNYFPPPKEHFVLNLASLNDEIYEKTCEHISNAVQLSKKLGSKKYSFHAGFFIDINVNEIGKKLSKNSLFNKELSIKRFCDGYNKLFDENTDIEIYLENNVFSSSNFKTYENENPFMLTNLSDYKDLKNMIDFKLLLDIAHLKVSSQTLGLSLESEFANLISCSDYLHISDNDSLHDLNYDLEKNSTLFSILSKQNLSDKNFTLEIYNGIDKIKKSYDILQEVIK